MLDEAIEIGDANPDKDIRKKDQGDKDEDPSPSPNQGKKPKGEEPKNLTHPRSHLPQKTHPRDHTTNDDVINDADQEQDDSVLKTDTATKNNWFKQPPRPPTPDPKWNKILSVVSVKINKLHGYGYLEEIVVRRANRQLYKLKEGDFVNLHSNDIEDMLFLVVQHKLFHLDGYVIVDLAVALRDLIFDLDKTKTCQEESAFYTYEWKSFHCQDEIALRRKEVRSLSNTTFLDEYECSSLALKWEGKDESKRLDHLKQDQEMLVIRIFSKRKKVFRERKKCEKIHAKRSGIGVQKTCNNDKSLSEIQLEHEKEDEFVMVVMKTLGGSRGESFGEECYDLGVGVLRFHNFITDILSFLVKFEWWFEQDIDDEEGDGGSEGQLINSAVWELSSSSGNFFWQWEHITGSGKTALEVGMDRTFNS
nr:hypothetical protein [Tanacetum cinerariifolium]